MLSWLSLNLPTLLAGAAVLALTGLSVRQLLPRKGKRASCAGCSGCSGCSGGNEACTSHCRGA